MTIHAKPQPNGNDRADFIRAYKALTAAKQAVDTAAFALLSDVANGRNYQHHVQRDDLTIKDRRRIQNEIQYINALLGEMQSDLIGAIGDD